jgi:hypothetical protein
MTAKVTILEGTYRNAPVTPLNGDFELVADWKEGKKGGFVTVLNNGSLDVAKKGAKVRINVLEENFEQTGELAGTFNAPKGKGQEDATPTFVETDEQTIARITKTFKYIETLTAAAQKNQVRALIISGPAGVGKSYGVETTLDRMNFQHTLANRPEKFEIITGGTSAIGLYIKLWDNRQEGKLIVFDDCDTALFDELQLNMLKAAMDTKKKRRICWMKESNALKGGGDEQGENIPNAFVFEGSIVFLTNLKFDKFGNRKIGAHLEAIMSRVHYLDLCLDSRREQLLRVKQVVGEGMLDARQLGKKMEDAVVNYVYDNVDYLQELSLRTVLKVADLAAIDAKTWEETADFTVLSHKGRMQKFAKAATA